jgi:hypothetical protein
MKLTTPQIETLQLIADAGGAGVVGRDLSKPQRKRVRLWLEAEPPLIRLIGSGATVDALVAHRVRLTPEGERVLGLKPAPRVAVSTHPRINQIQVAALQRMSKATEKSLWPIVPGYKFDPHEIRALQGLCRHDARHRLVNWRPLRGGRECMQGDMEDGPKDCEYWLTDDGKLFALGKMTIETYVREHIPRLEFVKRPPTGAALEEIMAAIRGDPDDWNKC